MNVDNILVLIRWIFGNTNFYRNNPSENILIVKILILKEKAKLIHL